MEGYPFNETLNSTCSSTYPSTYPSIYSPINYTPESVMSNIETLKEKEWLPIITMKEELINQLKDNSFIRNKDTEDSDDLDDLDEFSNSFIKFMKDFKQSQQLFKVAEDEMVKAIKENEKDIDTLTTFINFLDKLSHTTNKDTKELQNQIKTMCNEIKDTSILQQAKEKYSKHKRNYNKYLNIIRLINQTNVGSTCSICLGDNVNCYFNPCGHTACQKCTDKLAVHDNICPLCRKHITTTGKLYFT